MLRELAFNSERHHCFQQLATERAAAQRKAVPRQLHRETACAFLRRHSDNVTAQRTQHSPPINTFVVIKSSVLARQHSRDELWRDFAQRNLETIRACKAAVDLPIDVVNRASLWHFPDVFHVERLGPGAVKEKNGERSARQQKKQRYLPAVTKKNISARFLRASKASEQFHWLGNGTI